MTTNEPLLPGLVPMPDTEPEPLFSDAELAAMLADERLLNHPLRAHLEACEITPEKTLPKREFLFTQFQKPCFARGELVAVTGKSKSGKTFFCSSLMVAGSAGACLSLRRTGSASLKVLWIDTEQSEESTQEILTTRIRVLSGNHPLPRVFNLRAVSWDQRMDMVEAAIEVTMPDLVIFDGIRDVVSDINDGVMAQRVVERTMRLASGGGLRQPCCIVCVLHQNKAAEDSTLRGALGTELMNKCFETYECKKQEGGIFQVEQTSTRKYDIHDKLQFTVTDAGLPTLSYASQATEEAEQMATGNPYVFYENGKRLAKINLLLNDCLPGGKTLPPHLLAAELEKRLGNQLWAEKIMDSVVKRGGLQAMTQPDGSIHYGLPHA